MKSSEDSGARQALSCLAVVLAALTAVVLVVAVWLLLFAPQQSAAPGKSVQIEVAPGASTAKIARTLAAAGVVPNSSMFRLRVRIAGADGELRPGVYDLKTGMPYDVVIDALREGPPIKYLKLTIPEGFTVEQVAERVEKVAGIPAKEFLQLAKGGAAQFAAEHPYLEGAYQGSLEGYLFPKTYRVAEGASSSDIIEMMLDQFDEEIAQVDTGGARAARGTTLQELVTIASIIEREAQLDEERPLVASVIYNRLRKAMRLEIDATIEYVLPGNRFRLRSSQLRIKSPYNTYLNEGLPPGPIASPGLKSLQAAADPAETRYIYYVLTGKDGSHTYTTNLQDFLKAKQKSKEVFGR